MQKMLYSCIFLKKNYYKEALKFYPNTQIINKMLYMKYSLCEIQSYKFFELKIVILYLLQLHN